MCSVLKNERGDTLITVLCAMAVGTIVMAGTLTQMQTLSTANRTLEFRIEAGDLVNEGKLALTIGDSCRLNFQGQTLAAAGVPASVDQIRYPSADGTSLSATAALTRGQKFNSGVELRSISLVVSTDIAPTVHMVDIKFDFTKHGTFVPELSRNLRMYAQSNENRVITNCSLTATGAGPVTSGDDPIVCKAGGSCLDDWNFVNNGTPLTCPDGKLGMSMSQSRSTPMTNDLQTCTCAYSSYTQTAPGWVCRITYTNNLSNPGGGL